MIRRALETIVTALVLATGGAWAVWRLAGDRQRAAARAHDAIPPAPQPVPPRTQEHRHG